jgi:DNA-binding NtrC family response regulator
MPAELPANPQRLESGLPPLSELLVVDSDPQTVEFCRDLAGIAGLTVRAAQDSETALDVLESGLVDVLAEGLFLARKCARARKLGRTRHSTGTGEVLEPNDFPTQLSARLSFPPISANEPLRRVRRVLPIAEVERHAILNAVAEAKGDKLLAARMLGIGKTTLYRKLRQCERRQQPLPPQTSPATTPS